MSKVLAGKTAIVTGASRDIGAAITRNLASKGCSSILAIYTSDSSTPAAEQLKSSLETAHPGTKIHLLKCDLSLGEAAGHQIAQTIRSAFNNNNNNNNNNNPRVVVDILINNAGV